MTTQFGKAARQRLTLAAVPRESDMSDRLLDNSRQMVRLDYIDDNPRNPRAQVDDAALRELAASIAEHGLLQAPVVRRSPTVPDRYMVVLGARRVAAHRLLGRGEIEVIVRRMDDQRAFLASCVENVQRVALSPREEMDMIGVLIDELGSQEAVARALGKSPTWLSKRKRVLATPHLAAAVERGELSLDHAYDVLTRTPDEGASRAHLQGMRKLHTSQDATRQQLDARKSRRAATGNGAASAPPGLPGEISDRNYGEFEGQRGVFDGSQLAAKISDRNSRSRDQEKQEETATSLPATVISAVSDRNLQRGDVVGVATGGLDDTIALHALATVQLAATGVAFSRRETVIAALRADLIRLASPE